MPRMITTFRDSEEQLKFARAFYSDVIEEGNEDDGGDRNELSVRDGDGLVNEDLRQERQRSERAENTYEAGDDGGNRSWLRDEEVSPAVQESTERTVGVTDVHVLAARLRPHRAQFGITERAKPREQATNNPGEVDQRGGADRLHHLRGNQKDAAADHGSDHDRSCMADFQVAGELWLCGLGAHGRACSAVIAAGSALLWFDRNKTLAT